MKTISYSSIKSFQECPLRYKLTYINKVKTENKSSIYGALGSAFHLCIQKFYNNGIYTREALLGLWAECFKIETSKYYVEKISVSEKDRLLKQGYPILQKFFSYQDKHNLLVKPLATELEFNLNCKSKNNDNVLLVGKIDNIFKIGDEFEIVDYKSTASKQEWSKNKVDLQLVIYYIAFTLIKKQYKNAKCKVCLHFLRPGIKNYFNISKQDKIKALRVIHNHLKDVRTSDFKPNPNPYSCKFCQYMHLCEAKNINEKGIIKGKLFSYQKADVATMIKNKAMLNASDIGTGKTIEAIFTGEYLKKKENIKRALVLTPNAMRFQWSDEIHRFVKDADTTLINGDKTKRKLLYGQKTFWTIMSYSTLRIDEDIVEKNWDLIILDDPSIFKNWKTKTSKVIQKLKAPYKYILYATPIENNIMEIYNLIRWLNFFVLGKRSSFDNRYIERNYFNAIERYKNIQEFKDKIKRILIRRRFEDVIKDLPQTIIKNIYVDFLPEQEKLYNAMVEKLREYLEKELSSGKKDKIIDAETLAKFTYLREVCQSPKLIGVESPSSKLEELKRIVQNISPQKVVIFLEMAQMAEIIQTHIKNSITITGKDDANQKRNKIEKFRTSKDHNVLIATNVLTYGVNLQFAHHIINFDLPFTFSALSQRIGRERRIGQKYQVVVINLIMQHSIEERIVDIINYKKQLTQIIDDNETDTIDIPKANGITNKTVRDFLKDK